MKIRQVLNPAFTNSMRKLMAAKLPLATAIKLKKIVALIEKEGDTFETCRKEALSKVAKTDENGKIETLENGSIVFRSEEERVSFMKEIEAVQDGEIPVTKIKVSELGNNLDGVLSVLDLMALDPIIEE